MHYMHGLFLFLYKYIAIIHNRLAIYTYRFGA